MFEINKEYTYGNCSHVKGSYKGKDFGMDYFYSDGSARISGDFTEDEKSEIVSAFLMSGL